MGFWNDDSLIDKLAKDPTAARNLVTEIGKDLVITKLVLTWLAKKQAGAQYTLIIKKAEGWLKTEIASRKVDDSKLSNLEVN